MLKDECRSTKLTKLNLYTQPCEVITWDAALSPPSWHKSSVKPDIMVNLGIYSV
jgi:hypothetical protein